MFHGTKHISNLNFGTLDVIGLWFLSDMMFMLIGLGGKNVTFSEILCPNDKINFQTGYTQISLCVEKSASDLGFHCLQL